MKLRDFFLPKLANSDPDVRKKAIQEENNPELLKAVAEKDENYEVRQLAKIRLIDLEAMS
jgi:hypothetical protein